MWKGKKKGRIRYSLISSCSSHQQGGEQHFTSIKKGKKKGETPSFFRLHPPPSFWPSFFLFVQIRARALLLLSSSTVRPPSPSTKSSHPDPAASLTHHRHLTPFNPPPPIRISPSIPIEPELQHSPESEKPELHTSIVVRDSPSSPSSRTAIRFLIPYASPSSTIITSIPIRIRYKSNQRRPLTKSPATRSHESHASTAQVIVGVLSVRTPKSSHELSNFEERPSRSENAQIQPF